MIILGNYKNNYDIATKTAQWALTPKHLSLVSNIKQKTDIFNEVLSLRAIIEAFDFYLFVPHIFPGGYEQLFWPEDHRGYPGVQLWN